MQSSLFFENCSGFVGENVIEEGKTEARQSFLLMGPAERVKRRIERQTSRTGRIGFS
jgi:hypothetical protein